MASVQTTCGYSFQPFPRAGMVCEIELSHMGKNSGNSDLVCENAYSVL